MKNDFKISEIAGVEVKDLIKHADGRGWLSELYRSDELDEGLLPEMAYISSTFPGVRRGPHEHAEQTDYFCFLGPSDFKVILWDNRKGSASYGCKMILILGEARPASLVVPPGVVHAYMNIGAVPGLVINAANRLYAGKFRKEPVDEIRYENNPDTVFIFE